MKKIIIRVTLSVLVAALISFGGLLLRDHEMDEGVRAFKADNGTVALKHLSRLARLGDRTSQVLVGYIYAFGWAGVARNDEEAVYWLQKRGLFGGLFGPHVFDDPGSLELKIAKIYANGEQGVKPDAAASTKWLQLAANAGNPEAAALLKNDKR